MENIHGEDNGLPFIAWSEFTGHEDVGPPCWHWWGSTWLDELRSNFCRKCRRYSAENKADMDWLQEVSQGFLEDSSEDAQIESPEAVAFVQEHVSRWDASDV